MKTASKLFAGFALVSLIFASPSWAEAEKRIAFVVGNAAYQAGPLATSANDAGLIATLVKVLGKMRQRPPFGTGAPPRRDLFSPSLTSP